MDRVQQLQQRAMSARLSIADQLLHGQPTTIPHGYTELDISLAHKYPVINLDEIISENATDPQWSARVLVALDILRRYGKNLLRQAGNRPKEWRIIKFVNPIYVEKVQPLKGNNKIISHLGYIYTCEDSFKYPENVEPDMKHVAKVTAEILLAQADLKEFLSGKHVRHDDICSLMPPPARPVSQRPVSAARSQTQSPASQPPQTVYATAQTAAQHGGTPGQAAPTIQWSTSGQGGIPARQMVYSTAHGNAAKHGGIPGHTTSNIQWSTSGQGGVPAGEGAPPHRSTPVQHDPTQRNSLGQHETPQRVAATQGGTLTQGRTFPQGDTHMQHVTAQKGTPTTGNTPQQSSTHEQHALHQTGSTSQGDTTLPGGPSVQRGPIERGTYPQIGTTLLGGTQRSIPPQGHTQGGTLPQGGMTHMASTYGQLEPNKTSRTAQGNTFTMGGTALPAGTPMQNQSKQRGTPPQGGNLTQEGTAAKGGTPIQNESTWGGPPEQRSTYGQPEPTKTSNTAQAGIFTLGGPLQQGNATLQRVTPGPLNINTSSDNGPPSTIHPLPPTPQPDDQADVHPLTSAHVSSGAPYQQQPEIYSRENSQLSSSGPMVFTSQPQWFQPHGPMIEKKPPETQGTAQTEAYHQPSQGAPHNLNQTSPLDGIPAGQANYSETESLLSTGKPGNTFSRTIDIGNLTQGHVQTSDYPDYQIPPPRTINAPPSRGPQMLHQFAGSHFQEHGPMDHRNTHFPVSSPQDHAQDAPRQSQGMPVTMPDLSTASTGYQQHGPVPQTYGHPGEMSSSDVPYSGPSRTQEMAFTASYPQRAHGMSGGRAEDPAANKHNSTQGRPVQIDVGELEKMMEELELNRTKEIPVTEDNYLYPCTTEHDPGSGKRGNINFSGMEQKPRADGQDLNLYDGDRKHVYETIDDFKRQTGQTEKHDSGNKLFNKKERVSETSPQTQKTAVSHGQETEPASSDGGIEQHVKLKYRPLPPIECPHCGNINPAESAVCLRCDTGLLSDRNRPEMPPGRQTATNKENDAVAPPDGTHKVPGVVWQCERCRKVNPPDTRECTACKVLKEEASNIPKNSTQNSQKEVAPPRGESSMTAETTEPGWNCGFCTCRNLYGKKICSVCGKTNDVPLSDPAKAKEQEHQEDHQGEKICQKCFALNPQEGTTCVSCKLDFFSSTPKWDCEYCTSQNPYGRRICTVCGKTNNVPHMPPNTQHHDKTTGRDPDDWTCGHCPTVNNASVRICSACNRPKGTTQPAQGVTRHGLQGKMEYHEVAPNDGENEGTERTCPHCSFVNLADAELCISCANKLTDGRVQEAPIWAREIPAIQCSACGQLNPVTAQLCGQCRQRLYPDNDFGPKEGSDMHRTEVKCRHCTYVNPPNTRVCKMCDRTIELGAGTTRYDNIVAPDMTQRDEDTKSRRTRPCPRCNKRNHITADECLYCEFNMKEHRSTPAGIIREQRQFTPAEYNQETQGIEEPENVENKSIYQQFLKLLQMFPDLLKHATQGGHPGSDDPIPAAVDNQKIAELMQEPVLQQESKVNKAERPSGDVPVPGEIDNHESATFMHDSEEVKSSNGDIPPPTEAVGDDENDVQQKGGRDLAALSKNEGFSLGDQSLHDFEEEGIKVGFTKEEVAMALKKGHRKKPIAWLKTVWRKKLKEVVEAVEERCFQFDPLGAKGGQISSSEIRRALLKTGGDVDKAVEECERARRAMLAEVKEFGNFEEAKIHHFLFQKDGDLDETIHALSCSVLEPLAKRLDDHQEGDMILDDEQILFDSSFVEKICNPHENMESRVRWAMVMGGLDDFWEAMDVVRLLDEIDMNQNVSVRDVIEARKRCGSYQTALDCLQKACVLCKRVFSIDLLRSISFCTCITCRDCFVQQYSRMIREKQAWEFSCPICGLANVLENRTQTMNLFAELQNQLQYLLIHEDKLLLEDKILQLTLKGKEEFVWCSQCERGLFVNNLGDDLKCTNCDQVPQDLKDQLKECPLCMESFMMKKIQTLYHCQCHICTGCFTRLFRLAIETKSPASYTCPSCDEPDLGDADVAGEYFWFLENKLKHLLTPEEHSKLCTKIRDWCLRQDERFIWCSNSQCMFGFTYDGENKATCPKCQKKTCPGCKEAWEDAHENRTCDEFYIYKESLSAKGALDVLRLNKMHCPGCRTVFILERGGCQHLTCRQCNHQFCEGCGQPFDEKCERFEDCKVKGLHAHHPRNCSYYLRDERYDVGRLTRLLAENNVEYDVGAAVGDDNEDEDVNDQNNLCPVEIDDDNPDKDEKHPCRDLVEENQAGLCTKHYKEYLIKEINRHRLDPVEIMDEGEMIMVINREHKMHPAQNDRETLMQYIKAELPIHQER